MGNEINKARLFDNEVKIEDQLSAPKIVNILVEFGKKMEATLVEMRKLLPGPQSEPFRLPIPSLRDPLPKKFQDFIESMNKALMELRTLQQHRPGKEPVFEAEKVATPVPVVQVKAKVVEKKSETPKTKNFDPSPKKICMRKKKKKPTLESRTETEEEGSFEDVEEVEVKDSSKESELEEEEEVEPKLETPPPKKTRIKTRTSKRKKTTPVLKTLVSTKRLAKGKMPKKGESS